MKEKIEKFAKELGFSLTAFTTPQVSDANILAYKKWIEEGRQADMGYLEKIAPRKDFSKILKNAKTVISLATNYFYKQKDLKPGHGRIARYAYGRDYHKVIKKRLKKLETYIKELAPEAETRSYVDTGPILERAVAAQAGLGFIGKNTCLITKEFGSWVFLSEIITTLEFEADAGISADSKLSSIRTLNAGSTSTAARTLDAASASAKPLTPGSSITLTSPIAPPTVPSSTTPPFSICGSCRLCIDACPTKAIISPGVIDARRCISYQTIENKTDKIPEEFATAIAKTKRIFGCDICQEVCPHNSRAQETKGEGLASARRERAAREACGSATVERSELKNKLPVIASDQLNLQEILDIKTDQAYLEKFAGSPLMRAKKKGLQRNASASQKKV